MSEGRIRVDGGWHHDERVADEAVGAACQMQVAMDLMGSYSTAHEYHVEKCFRDLQQAALWLGGRYRVQMDTVLDYYPYAWS